MANSSYPASPTNVSNNLTNLPPSYLFRAVLAIIAVLLFFVLYAAMVTACAYLAYAAFMYDILSFNKLTILMKIGAIAGSVMLFVFTLKFIFNLKNHKPANRIQLTKNEYPELWGFIYQICKETGAPQPKSIYADPDVNAYVSYTNMWLSLFLPVRKDLTIGLGLVSCINLTEFKAVMSHEFGHFSQNSMKIGSYIVSANTIIHDMIFSRDKWDDLLDNWRDSDIRLSAAAWLITPVIWIIRELLNLFYQFLNRMHSSLSREMEFNADKVAVKTTGSEAIISGLWKLDGGVENWNATMNNTYLAAQKDIYVNNLYRHNQIAITRGAEKQNFQFNKLKKDSRGGKLYFSTSEVSKVGMYASHPPNDMREANAKAPYVECAMDETSPWVLFGSKELLQEKMSLHVYKEYFNKTASNFVSPEAFEEFIEQENTGKELLKEYDGAFENRFITIPEIEELEKVTTDTRNVKGSSQVLKFELRLLMLPIKEIEKLMLKAQNIAEGSVVEKSFSFKGKDYNKKTLVEGYEALNVQREKLFNETFVDWDKSFCAFYLKVAEQKDQKSGLANVYKQHMAITKFYKKVVSIKNRMLEEVNQLQNREDVSESEVGTLGERIKLLFFGLNKDLDALDENTFVPMPNIENLTELKSSIVDGGAFEQVTGRIFENGEFDNTLLKLDNVISHCQRLDQKSIGVILAYHKRLE